MISRSGGRSAAVALPAEGVDRNFWMGVKPSSRLVVLLAEGVDRNSFHSSAALPVKRRPPHGGRG